MIVMKFGGSSLESKAALERVSEIVRTAIGKSTGYPLVVVSAMGKTTNRLLEMAEIARGGDGARASTLLAELKSYTLSEGMIGDSAPKIEALFNELGELLRGLSILEEIKPSGYRRSFTRCKGQPRRL
jgi:aspartokinase